MTRKVLTVACRIPGDFGEYVDFKSKTSLLDADFVLFYPTLGYWSQIIDVRSSPLPVAHSEELQRAIVHWRTEINAALDAGKTVFMMLSDVNKVKLTSNNLDLLLESNPVASNYDIVSNLRVIESIGTSMRLASNNSLLAYYWQQFKNESQYRVYIANSEGYKPLITTRHGDRIVGAKLNTKGGGTLIALPWIDLQKWYDHDNLCWVPEADEWGKKYFETLKTLDEAVRSASDATLTPSWVLVEEFKTIREARLSRQLIEVQSKITEYQKQMDEIERKLKNAGSLKGLLFEQGHTLEIAVHKAMKLMGFQATGYRDSNSEFDAVLECSEGRCIGEVEGRDRRAINIDKMRQLMSNVHEDLMRDEVSAMAKPVLFGNAYRLTLPRERPPEHFTEKCISAAQQNGTALVRTCDLFTIAKALSDNPDEEFAAACRNTILSTNGGEVKFPPPP